MFFKKKEKKEKKEIDTRHHYRYNWYFKMWMHTGQIHFIENR